MLLVDKKMNCSSEVRKKRTFDIAFLTGQDSSSGEQNPKIQHQNERMKNKSPPLEELEDSNSSSIDVTTDDNEIRKVRKKEIRFESKRTIEQTSDSLKIKENVEFSFPPGVSLINSPGSDHLQLPHSFLPHLSKFYHHQPNTTTTFIKSSAEIYPKSRFPDFYYPPPHSMMESQRHFHPHHHNHHHHHHQQQQQQQSNSSSVAVVAAAAAAATLLPPSLTALTLPAQNVCAKCNIGFRMTSDLVYHMRSHHKRDGDPQKKKREDKLKCPVCHESFRERHHLTRHMTAHQDRAEEREDPTAVAVAAAAVAAAAVQAAAQHSSFNSLL